MKMYTLQDFIMKLPFNFQYTIIVYDCERTVDIERFFSSMDWLDLERFSIDGFFDNLELVNCAYSSDCGFILSFEEM